MVFVLTVVFSEPSLVHPGKQTLASFPPFSAKGRMLGQREQESSKELLVTLQSCSAIWLSLDRGRAKGGEKHLQSLPGRETPQEKVWGSSGELRAVFPRLIGRGGVTQLSP